jgi:hypothetical protein
MTQTTYNDNVLIDGSQDIKQLRVQGHTTQNQPLQTWEDSAGNIQAQVTGDGRVLVGDDVGLASPDALIEAHRADTSTSKPKRGIHSLGRVSGTLSALVQWMVGELELRGSTAIDALHTALRIRASNMNTGTPTANAELRAADIEVINDAAAGAAALTNATGLQVGVTNASGKTISKAIGLKVKMNNAGTISNPFSIYTEGPGVIHLEDYLEVKRPSSTPGTPTTDFVRIYSKPDGKLYAKNWTGTEFDLTGSGNPSAVLVPLTKLSASQASISLTGPWSYDRLLLRWFLRTDYAGGSFEGVLINFNSDVTAANYRSATTVNGTLTEHSSSPGVVIFRGATQGVSAANLFASFDVWIDLPNQTGTCRNVRAAGLDPHVYSSTGFADIISGGVWKDTTNAITAITVKPLLGANFVANSSYVLYGYKES